MNKANKKSTADVYNLQKRFLVFRSGKKNSENLPKRLQLNPTRN